MRTKRTEFNLKRFLDNLTAQVAAGQATFTEHKPKCPLCDDTGFVLRRDDKGREWGAHCDCTTAAIAAAKTTATGPGPKTVYDGKPF